MKTDKSDKIDLGRRRWLGGLGAGAAWLGAGALVGNASASQRSDNPTDAPQAMVDSSNGLDPVQADTVSASATNIPPAIDRDHAVSHTIELEAREVEAPLDQGAPLRFMTFNGQVPGPMIRVRQGDTVNLTLHNVSTNTRLHNVDMHAVYATGGGSAATTVAPGEQKTETFQCQYPGAFIYHCAAPGLDEHISRGMFGLILVEPPDGLPPVDREFYVGQHEVYTKESFGTQKPLSFDWQAMAAETPSFVVFNGAVNGYTPARFGRLQANVGETVRVFMVNGGPNLTSSLHPIGNVWARAWPQGALANEPQRYLQTQGVPPGSCFVGDMELPVAETIKLVDHALSRVVHHGLSAEIEVTDS